MEKTNKKALVTGGTSGIGRSMVFGLADAGFDVSFVGTSTEKGKQVEQELREGNRRGTGQFIRLDLGDLRAVRAFAAEFAAEHAELDVLANVAGVMLPKREETADGHEKTFAIDHLAAFVLSHELAPSLARASHGRIVNVSGPAKQMLAPRLDFDDLQLERGYGLTKAVINGVHAKTVMTQILAERYRADGIDVVAFDPGAVRTGLGRNLKFPLNLMLRAASVFMAKTSKAATFASTSPAITGKTGQFVVGEQIQPLNFAADYKGRLWDATVGALPFSLEQPGRVRIA